jgi:tetratricopeptide (TPR) repeat protein
LNLSNKTASGLIRVGAFLIVICATVSAQIRLDLSNPNQIGNELRTVTGLIRVGEYARALGFLDRMKATYGDDPRITDSYKQVFKQAKMYPELENLIQNELAGNPGNPNLTCDLAESRFLQNDEARADSLWRKALALGRNDEMTYRYVADSHLRYGLYDSAIDIYLQGRKNLGSPSRFALELAGIFEALRDYSRAVDEYISQIIENPEKLAFVADRIRGLAEDSDNPGEIVAAIDARLKETAGRAELNEILGDLHIKLGDMNKALECYKAAGLKRNDDGYSLIRFAIRAYESKVYLTAINAIDEYFKLSKNAAFKDLALFTKAKSQYAADQFDKAQANFKILTATSVDYRIKDEAGFLNGLIYAQDKSDCDSAMGAWGSMLLAVRDPSMQNRARLEMAFCNIKEDKYAIAEPLLLQVASSKTPDQSVERSIFLLGELALYSGDFKKADEIFKQLVRQFPTSDHSNDALARIDVMALAGETEADSLSLRLFATAMKAWTLNRPLEAALTLSDSSMGQSAIAEQASFYSGLAFAEANVKDKALGALKKYVDDFPDGLYNDRAYLEMGDIYSLDPANLPDARSAYNAILELFPNGPVTEIARQKLRQLETPGKIG